MVSDKLDRATMVGNTEGMILHARAAANVSQDENLDRDARCSKLLMSGWTENKCKNQSCSRNCSEPKNKGSQQ